MLTILEFAFKHFFATMGLWLVSTSAINYVIGFVFALLDIDSYKVLNATSKIETRIMWCYVALSIMFRFFNFIL